MPNGSPRIAAVTKSYQEAVMLPLWVAHYSKLVGRANLYILDHGSTPPIAVEGVHVERLARTNVDEWESIAIVGQWQRLLLETYDWVVCTDTDEFIVPRPGRWQSLSQYLTTFKPGTLRCVGVKVLDPGDRAPVDWSKPILRQRPAGIITSWSCKPSVSGVPTTWHPGFHTCEGPSTFEHDLWLFHLKFADIGYLMKRLAFTRELEWSEATRAAQLAGSHRVPDVAMQRHVARCQERRASGTLDDYLATNPDPNIADSQFLDIPAEFLSTI